MRDYDYLKQKFSDELFVGGTNEDGENVVLSFDGMEDDRPIIRLDTFQHNDWIRVNIYHYDGTVEELYER